MQNCHLLVDVPLKNAPKQFGHVETRAYTTKPKPTYNLLRKPSSDKRATSYTALEKEFFKKRKKQRCNVRVAVTLASKKADTLTAAVQKRRQVAKFVQAENWARW